MKNIMLYLSIFRFGYFSCWGYMQCIYRESRIRDALESTKKFCMIIAIIHIIIFLQLKIFFKDQDKLFEFYYGILFKKK